MGGGRAGFAIRLSTRKGSIQGESKFNLIPFGIAIPKCPY